jgi:hypothetical protein
MGMYPHLPKYIVEIALDYDSNQVKPTGTRKRSLNAQRQRDADMHENENVDCDPTYAIKVVKRTVDYKIDGHIEVDGINSYNQNLDRLKLCIIQPLRSRTGLKHKKADLEIS